MLRFVELVSNFVKQFSRFDCFINWYMAKILLVDDDTTFCLMLKTWLTKKRV